jgi:hypothetical protein
MTQNSTARRVKDAEDQASLVQRESQERVLGMEAESATSLASAREETEALVRKIALLHGELAEVRRAREVAKETTRGLSSMVADAEWQWEESKRGHWEQLEELILLQTRGSELCLAIIGPPQVRNHLLEGMRIAALRHTKMAGELAMLLTVMSYAMEFALGARSMKPYGWKLWMS